MAAPDTTRHRPRGQRQRNVLADDAPAERLVYTVPQAGRLLGLSRNGAYEAAKRGELPTIRVGRLLLVPKARFQQMLGLMPTETVVPFEKSGSETAPGCDGQVSETKDRGRNR